MAKTWFSRAASLVAFMVVLALVFSASAFAETAGSSAESPAGKFFKQQYLFGDWGGARTKLAEEKGISFDVFLQTDMLGAVKGAPTNEFGVWTRVRPTMDIDMGKLAKIKGMSLHITATWNNGTDVARHIGALGNATGNDTGERQARLDSFWVKQDLFKGKLSLYGGQISGFDFFGFVPQDFAHYTMLGPFYAPLALYNNYSSWDPNTTPAAMIQITPNKHFYYRSMIQAITTDNLTRNETGTGLDVRDGALWNNEVAFLYGQASKDKAKSLPGEVHFGFGYTGASKKIFPVQNPSKVIEDGQTNFYWIVKQAVWRPTAGSSRGLDLGTTIVWGPEDKGVLPFNRQIVTTAEFNGLIPSRAKDSINFAFVYSGIRDFLNTPARAAAGLPVTSEKAYEINYAFQAAPFFQIMPVIQFYQDPGANSLHKTGTIAGVRTRIHF